MIDPVAVMDPPTVSVVVPTFNRKHRLIQVLDALAGQTSPPDEIVVVSDGSTDGTDEVLERLARERGIVPVLQDNAGVSVARNAGVAASSGDVIVFVDDDLVPSEHLVSAHVDAHRFGDRNTVVIGPMLDPPGHRFEPWTAWEQQMLAKQYAAMMRGDYDPTPRQFYTANASLRREFFEQSGGFDPAYRRMEDVELAWRLEDLGAAWVFEPRAEGWHYAERSFESWLSIADAYDHNDVRLAHDQGRDDILTAIVREYGRRRIPLRVLLQVTLRSTWASRLLRWSTEVVVTNTQVRLPRAGRGALSCTYADAYYAGVIDELGGRRRFQELMGWRR